MKKNQLQRLFVVIEEFGPYEKYKDTMSVDESYEYIREALHNFEIYLHHSHKSKKQIHKELDKKMVGFARESRMHGTTYRFHTIMHTLISHH